MGVRLTAEKEILGVISPVDTSEKFDHLYLEIDADADIVSLKRIENLIASHMLAVQLVQNQRQKMLNRLDTETSHSSLHPGQPYSLPILG